ncbi:MAG: hypothetical protein IJ458_03970 [Clostridia bacterium]|nr:hypothetical protein [Clostridia bacterium]
MSDKFFNKFETNNIKQKKKFAKLCREKLVVTNSKADLRTVCKTFTITRKDDQFYLQIVNVLLGTKHKNEKGSSYFNQYYQAIKSLAYNNNFILSAQNFKDFDIDNKNNVLIVDLDGKRNNTTFEYSNKLLSNYEYDTHIDQVREDMIKSFITTLEAYAEIIKELQPYVDKEKELAPDSIELFNKVEDFKNGTLITTKNIITAINNGKINVSKFANSVCFDDIKLNSNTTRFEI